MFNSLEDQIKYIKENYEEVTDSRIDEGNWDIFCSKCNIVRGFKKIVKSYNSRYTSGYEYIDFQFPLSLYFECPVCKSYKMWIVFSIEDENNNTSYFKVSSVPNEGVEDIEGLPDSPASLRKAYKQAIRSFDANAYIASAAMFRRALQIITRDILGAKPDTLDKELKSLIGKKYNGVTLTNDFANIGYIIKQVGNQGAHPDSDPDLLDFTKQDAQDMQHIFMELVSDLFIIPEISKKAKIDFLKRRKISI